MVVGLAAHARTGEIVLDVYLDPGERIAQVVVHPDNWVAEGDDQSSTRTIAGVAWTAASHPAARTAQQRPSWRGLARRDRAGVVAPGERLGKLAAGPSHGKRNAYHSRFRLQFRSVSIPRKRPNSAERPCSAHPNTGAKFRPPQPPNTFIFGRVSHFG
jgi:hypothetical protein